MPRTKKTQPEETRTNESSTQQGQQIVGAIEEQQEKLSPILEPLDNPSPEQPTIKSNPTPEAIGTPVNLVETEQTTQPCKAESDFLAASLKTVTASMGELFEKQAELSGQQAADSVFDAYESAFINRLEQRLQPLVDSLLPQIRDSHAELQERSTAKLQRRRGLTDRLKQIATLVSDECKLLPPITAIGELVSWDVPDHDQQKRLEQGDSEL